MQLLNVVPLIVRVVDETPNAEDVKAGWAAFAIFLALIVAVAFLGWSLTRQLRKAQDAEDAGLYDPSDKKPVDQIPVDPGPEARS